MFIIFLVDLFCRTCYKYILNIMMYSNIPRNFYMHPIQHSLPKTSPSVDKGWNTLSLAKKCMVAAVGTMAIAGLVKLRYGVPEISMFNKCYPSDRAIEAYRNEIETTYFFMKDLSYDYKMYFTIRPEEECANYNELPISQLDDRVFKLNSLQLSNDEFTELNLNETPFNTLIVRCKKDPLQDKNKSCEGIKVVSQKCGLHSSC